MAGCNMARRNQSGYVALADRCWDKVFRAVLALAAVPWAQETEAD